ncbi:MAG: arginine--tRNA ligase [bacterium]
MLQILKNNIKDVLETFYKEKGHDITIVVEQPKNLEMGDVCVPIFSIVKTLKEPLPKVAEDVKQILLNKFDIIKEINPTGGFLNIIVNKGELAYSIQLKTFNDKNVGESLGGKDKTVVLDYSSPNIAKSFSIGHLRSTMIGNSLKNIYEKCGYNTVSINYLGDWGTQFGKMIVAYKLWGDKKVIENDPINELGKLYVKFHKEAESDESLNDQAREAFRKLEQYDKESLDLWKWIKDESLKESEEIYKLLDIKFDSYNGEAYYNDKMDSVVTYLEKLELLKEDQGAMIVDLGDDVPPALIKRKDGGSLYITRDLAAIFDRYKTHNFVKCLYVVGNEQKLHFSQLKRVLNKMNQTFSEDITHVNFGLILKNGKKMSTRDGGVVKLQDVLDLAINQALKQICEKNPTLENKEEIAKNVGVGAIVFNDLKNHRTLNYEFDLEKMLKFEGQTGPYLQYTIVRIKSILNTYKFDENSIKKELFELPHYFELGRSIGEYESTVIKACEEDAPSVIAKYLLSLAQLFNKFYSMEKLIVDDLHIKNTNFLLASNVCKVIADGLNLLGIKTVERM